MPQSAKGKEKAIPGEVKEEDESTGVHGSTLFISSLPYSTTSSTLEAAFSDIAPVRNAFIVTQWDAVSNTAKSKGVGFVSFAIKEDAAQGLSRYGKGGEDLIVDGRRVRIEWAQKKSDPAQLSDLREHSKSNKASVPKTEEVTANHTAPSSSIVISSLPPTITKKEIWKKLRKYEGIKSVDFPISEGDHKARALFEDDESAEDARLRLHESTFKGHTIRALDSKGRTVTQRDGPKGQSKGSRLIIRNLPTNISEDDIHSLFSNHGSVLSVNFPNVVSEGSRVKPRRFAFVWMKTTAEAAAALKAINGRAIALSESGIKVEDDVKPESGRTVAVDYALPKDAWERAQQSQSSPQALRIKWDASEDEMDVDQESENDEEDQDTDVEEDSESSDMDSTDAESREDEDDNSSHLPKPEEGTTLFLRNVPFEATDDDLRDLFRGFGPLRYARVTLSPETGRSRGTGFVCFWSPESAQKVLKEAEALKLNSAASTKTNAQQSFSVLTPDPSSSTSSKLVLMGRTLDVTLAVSRDDASRLKEAAEKVRQKKQDGRNLYLLREGVIFDGTPAAQALPPAVLQKRLLAFEQRRDLLRSNPALFMSRTRLSVRNLPRFVTDRGLKRLALHAITSFDTEVSEGSRESISKDELEIDHEIRSQTVPLSGKKRGGHLGMIRQSKIGRHKTQVDAMHPHNLGKSEGYGFVEFEMHSNALKVLRWANNRPGVTRLLWEWWQEELKEWISRAPKPDSQQSSKVSDESKARLELWERTLGDMEGNGFAGKDKPLLVEFAVENKVITKRRSDKLSKATGASQSNLSKEGPSAVKRTRQEDRDDAMEDVQIAKKVKSASPKKPKTELAADPSKIKRPVGVSRPSSKAKMARLRAKAK